MTPVRAQQGEAAFEIARAQFGECLRDARETMPQGEALAQRHQHVLLDGSRDRTCLGDAGARGDLLDGGVGDAVGEDSSCAAVISVCRGAPAAVACAA